MTVTLVGLSPVRHRPGLALILVGLVLVLQHWPDMALALVGMAPVLHVPSMILVGLCPCVGLVCSAMHVELAADKNTQIPLNKQTLQTNKQTKHARACLGSS